MKPSNFKSTDECVYENPNSKLSFIRLASTSAETALAKVRAIDEAGVKLGTKIITTAPMLGSSAYELTFSYNTSERGTTEEVFIYHGNAVAVEYTTQGSGEPPTVPLMDLAFAIFRN